MGWFGLCPHDVGPSVYVDNIPYDPMGYEVMNDLLDLPTTQDAGSSPPG